MKKILIALGIIGFVTMFASSGAWAGLQFGTVDGDGTSQVTVPIEVDTPTDVAGAAFTVRCSDCPADPTISVSSEFFETFVEQQTASGETWSETEVTVGGITYDQPVLPKGAATGAEVKIAAARFDQEEATVDTPLFTLTVTATTDGSYTLEIVATELSNTDAGYDAGGETIDLLIGAENNDFPVRLQRNADENYIFANKTFNIVATSGPTPGSGDPDESGSTNIFDLLTAIDNLGDVTTPGSEADACDIDRDGDVDIFDLLAMIDLI